MTFISKEVWYDWYGANEALFKDINGRIRGDWYESLMVLLSRSAEHIHFPHIVAGMAIYGLVDYFLRKIGKRSGAAHCLIAWFGVILVFVAANLVDAFVIHHMKTYFEFPRPYVALGPESVTLIDFHHDTGEDNQSFPSGHAAFITVLVASLWPVLSVGPRWLGVWLIAAVCWSRIAEGMHFPADVTGGFLVSLIVVIMVRAIIYKPLLKLKLRC